MSASLTEIFEYENFFYETYHNENNIIRQDSPELNLVNFLCAGDVDGAMSLFQEYQQFGNVKSTVDVPQGRFEGLDEIQDFCSNWLNYAKADSSYAVPVKQTRSGGRSCTELMLHFRYDKYGKEVKFPACVVGDLRGHGQLDEVRMYFFFKWLPDLSPYRHRIFRPSHNAQVELNSVCNVIREYSDALANLHFKGGMERILNTMTDDIVYGGYRPESISGIIKGKEKIEKKYRSFVNVPQIVRFESIIDNGLTSVCEWVGVRRDDYIGNRIPLLQSGVGIYDRDPESGKIKAVRIIDNFRFENEIDWSKADILY